MLIKMKIHKWLLTAWLIRCSCVGVSATADMLPMRSTSVYTTSYRGAIDQKEVDPTYQFRSTSTCTPVVGHTRYGSNISDPFSPTKPNNGPRLVVLSEDFGWDTDDDGDPVGEAIGQMDTPVGEPLCLLVFAMLYGFYLWRKHQRLEMAQSAKNE